jgi:hypothetical protein
VDSFHHSSYLAQVGIPTSPRHVVRVADSISIPRPFAADVTSLSHHYTSFQFNIPRSYFTKTLRSLPTPFAENAPFARKSPKTKILVLAATSRFILARANLRFGRASGCEMLILDSGSRMPELGTSQGSSTGRCRKRKATA